jgi:adenylosuccinate synthase
VNGFTELALTKLDILTGLDPLKLCLAYRHDEDRYSDLPDGPADLSPFTPEYEELPGWHTDLWQVHHWDDLPPEAQSYIRRVEELTKLKVRLISVGPEREQVIRRDIGV